MPRLARLPLLDQKPPAILNKQARGIAIITVADIQKPTANEDYSCANILIVVVSETTGALVENASTLIHSCAEMKSAYDKDSELGTVTDTSSSGSDSAHENERDDRGENQPTGGSSAVGADEDDEPPALPGINITTSCSKSCAGKTMSRLLST